MPDQPVGEPIIVARDVTKVYRPGLESSVALRGVNLTVQPGEFLAIVGPSGSGKSTLLNLVAGIDRPSSGSVRVQGLDVSTLDEDSLARWRGQAVGIIFQFFQLLPTLTALENVMLAMELNGRYRGERRQQALKRLEAVGLADLADHLPSELSGGEQQRVAVARALANDPPLLLADEPTGNLDSAAGQRIVDLLADFHARGKTVLLVTHERDLTARATRIVEMRDGKIV
ncbi:MAG: ABC transporter ATP-binding protein [Anaerolineae bacterium]|nr:ABC transporter ATP-binding protein [Anaerolineae bacterium]